MIARAFAAIRKPGSLAGQISRFLMVTAMSALVTLGLPIILHEVAGLSPPIAVGIAFVVAFCFTFVSTRRLVFASDGSVGRDLTIFVASTAAFRLSEYFVFLILSEKFAVHYVVALVFTLTISSVSKFFWYKQAFGSNRR